MPISWFEYRNIYENHIDSAVEGWFNPGDIALFYVLNKAQEQVAISGDLCEVGAHHGKSAIALALFAAENERLWIFDLFYEDPGGTNLQANMAKFCPGILPRMTIESGDTKQIKALPEAITPLSLRWLHIDANHEYDWVMNDLSIFTPMVRRDGIVVMDDFFNNEFPGVPVALVEFLLSPAGADLRPFASSRDKLFLCHRDSLSYYQEAILDTGIVSNRRFTRFIDTDMLMCFSFHGLQYK